MHSVLPLLRTVSSVPGFWVLSILPIGYPVSLRACDSVTVILELIARKERKWLKHTDVLTLNCFYHHHHHHYICLSVWFVFEIGSQVLCPGLQDDFNPDPSQVLELQAHVTFPPVKILSIYFLSLAMNFSIYEYGCSQRPEENAR